LLTVIAASAAAQIDGSDQEALSPAGIAGEIMDRAVEHCRRGESAQAMSMFGAMRAQLDPPPAILRLIDDLQATGCQRQSIAATGAALRLQLGSGWDSNVSQGISARSLVLGSGDNLLELELDDSYRPRSSAFVQAALDYTLSLPAYGLDLQAGLAQRKNTRERAFDLTIVSAAASREFKLKESALRAQLELSEVWLANRHYQRSQTIGAQWLLPTQRGAWLANLNATSVSYLTQAAQNAWQWEAGLLREQRLSASQSVHAGISLQLDDASGARPGGDRKGFQAQVGAVVLADGWRFKPQLSYTYWNSAELFAPGLLDVNRRHRLSQAVFQAEKPMGAQTSLVLEWRGRWARDTVSLYRYQAQGVSATLSHRF